MGGTDNLKAARSYYAAAIEFSGGDNVRALWGVCMVRQWHLSMTGQSISWGPQAVFSPCPATPVLPPPACHVEMPSLN